MRWRTTWLVHYATATPGCEAARNATWLMADSAPQPDAELHILPKFGGRSSTEKDYFAGAPELAIDICASPGDDFGPKLAL